MSFRKKIILLTSRENYVWTSMQEIIPFIVQTWTRMCSSNHFELIIIDVDQHTPKEYLKDLMSSDLIVVTCFNTKIAHFLKVTRKTFNIDSRIFFYLHGLATIALWPLERFGLLPLLSTRDIFIGTCDGDLNSMKITAPNARSIKVPFTIPNFKISESKLTLKPFVFIGRISPQKNLHELIEAYVQLPSIIKDKHPLFIYGSEDNLGFPNVGITERHYLHKLQELADKNIHFKGFVERQEIQDELGQNFYFVSPSTHSDENFGMAAFRSLLSGAPCLLSDWGGHKEYKNYFSGQVLYLNPHAPVDEMKTKLQELLTLKSEPTFPSHFSLENIENELLKAINEQSVASALQVSDLAKRVFETQKIFEANGEIQRCFHSFEDPAFKAFFEAYKSDLY